MFNKKKKVQDPLRPDIAEAAERASITRVMFGKTLRRMEDKLMHNEQVLDMAQVNHDRRAGVLVRTNYRLWFTVDSSLGNVSDAIAIERISSAKWTRDITKRRGIGTMVVTTSGRETKYELVPEQFAAGVQMASA